MTNATDYTGPSDGKVFCKAEEVVVHVRPLGLLEIFNIMETQVLDEYRENIRGYVDMLSDGDDKVTYIQQARADEPKGDHLFNLALAKADTKAGQIKLLTTGIDICNPNLRGEYMLTKLTQDESDQIIEILFRTLNESVEAVEKKAKAAKKKPGRKNQSSKS